MKKAKDVNGENKKGTQDWNEGEKITRYKGRKVWTKGTELSEVKELNWEKKKWDDNTEENTGMDRKEKT